MIGNKFGRLTVIERVGSKKCGAKFRALWLCQCECGNTTTQPTISLTTGHTSSCGCLRQDVPARLKHGHACERKRSKAYQAWIHLRNRSYSRTLIDYDPRWDSFENFLADMGNPSDDGLQLDRKDNTRGYCKANCHWVTQTQNARNRTNTLKIDGVPLAQIAEQAGVKYDALYYRIVTKRLPVADAITQSRAA